MSPGVDRNPGPDRQQVMAAIENSLSTGRTREQNQDHTNPFYDMGQKKMDRQTFIRLLRSFLKFKEPVKAKMKDLETTRD